MAIAFVLLRWRAFSLPPLGKVAVNEAKRREQTDEVSGCEAAGCREAALREERDLIHRLRRFPFSNGRRLRARHCGEAGVLRLPAGWRGSKRRCGGGE